MRNGFAWIVLVAMAGGAWYVLSHFRIAGIDDLRLEPRSPDAAHRGGQVAVHRTGETIRIATLNPQVLGNTKIAKPHVLEMLARMCRQFDVVALQEIRSSDEDIVPRLVEAINAAGRHYDYAIGPRLPYDGPPEDREQYAFVFDQSSLEIDRLQLYTIDDPDDLLVREPLVGWFRVRGPPPEHAFTFTLVNLQLDPDRAREEAQSLEQIYRAVISDGRDEDDVLLLGGFHLPLTQLLSSSRIAGAQVAVRHVPTTVRGDAEDDNLLFQLPATSEFVGRAGVFDFMREYNLTLDQALEITDHLPVWAEFTVAEGGRPAAVAGGQAAPRR